MIVGGGRGVSSVVAAQQVGSSGSIDVFEGSIEFAEVVRAACEKTMYMHAARFITRLSGQKRTSIEKGNKKELQMTFPSVMFLKWTVKEHKTNA